MEDGTVGAERLRYGRMISVLSHQEISRTDVGESDGYSLVMILDGASESLPIVRTRQEAY